jgi:HK97 family phage major capsid protein
MTQSAKEYLERQVRQMIASAREVTEKANDEGRSLTAEEKTIVEKTLGEVALIKGRVQELEDNEKLQATIDEMGNLGKAVSDDPETSEATSIGDAFLASEKYKALRERGFAGKWSTGAFELKIGKAVGDIGSGETVSETDSPDFVQPQVLPGIRTPGEERLTIEALLGSGTTDTNTIKYLEEIVTDNAAAAVAEGGEKPASYLEFGPVDEPVRKVATFLPVSDELLEDESGLRSYLNARLSLFVQREVEDQLLNGNGTPPNLSGLLDRTIGAAAAGDIGGTNRFDAIMAGITDVRVNGFLEPDAMVIHPIDAAQMAIERADGGGNYFSGGPYVAPAQNPWGLRAVITSAIAQGSVLIGAFREGAQVFRRGGLVVEASNSHADWFRKDLTAIRAEQRLALAVYRPGAFTVVTLPS